MIYITECPRDAMQGLDWFVDTDTKIAYIQALYNSGFDRLDFTSFVSPKAIAQMQDADIVARAMEGLNGGPTLLAIVANERGAKRALSYKCIDYLGFPLSISETFQLRNTNKTISQAIEEVKFMLDLCSAAGRKLQIYLSMAFGNPYNEPFGIEQIHELLRRLENMGIGHVAISDTIGAASPELVHQVFSQILPAYKHMIISAHLHSSRNNAFAIAQAALQSGCKHFDTALGGFGGCPMATDKLTGNLPTEILLDAIASTSNQTKVKKETVHALLAQYKHIFEPPIP